MKRKIIQIDQDKCNGCGLCAQACHEGAIEIKDGKAQLIRDDYCDGFGDCLPHCPQEAITFVEREAAAYDEKAVELHKQRQAAGTAATAGSCPGSQAHALSPAAQHMPSGCPGSRAQMLRPVQVGASSDMPATAETSISRPSQLRQWPVQIKLLPVQAPFYENAHLLIAADCTAYAFADFHQKFIKNRITAIGCPKLDEGDYTEKLTEIIRNNTIKSVTIVRMDVPCCGGIERAAVQALQASGKFIPWQVITIGRDGSILDE